MGETTIESFTRGVIIFIQGYLDKGFGEELRKKVGELADTGAKIVALSFRDCPIVNSTGMAKLIETIETASEKNVELWFSDLSNLHKQTFEAAGMIDLIQRITTEKEARELLTG